jgi:tellurite resistance protein
LLPGAKPQEPERAALVSRRSDRLISQNSREMVSEDKIQLLARVARAKSGPTLSGDPDAAVSILGLAASWYGTRPADEATVPTGFDPLAVALFEAIVEGAYLVASADGVFDVEERKAFEKVVTTACGGAVVAEQISALVDDLGDQLAEDGLDRRIAGVAEQVLRKEHAREVLRIAALLAHSSEDVSAIERATLIKLAAALKLDESDVDLALADVERELGAAR